MNKNIKKKYFGHGSHINIEKILHEISPKNILVVHGNKSYYNSGVKIITEKYIKKYNYLEFSNFTPNPQLKDMRQLDLTLNKFDTIIGMGGGSVIDVAKFIKLSYYKLTNKKIPLIAIPTTCGSGSEATYYIVYYEGLKKISEGDPSITLPDYSICDPTFIMNIPKNIAAASGMDAIGQAIESFWSKNATDASKRYASIAIKILLKELVQSITNPTKNNKNNIMKAAHYGGQAINISKTTGCHAISYFLTSRYNIPHGHAVALTLAEMIEYNLSKGDNTDLLPVLNSNTIKEAKEKINNMMEEIGLERNLSKLGIKYKDIKIISSHTNSNRLKNNPRQLTEENITNILKKIW